MAIENQCKGPDAIAINERRMQVRAAAHRSLSLEIIGLQALKAQLDSELGEAFDLAVDRIRKSKGRVIVSGMGKSGHIGRKIAATLSSTGTPSLFIHPAEASHGDLGMVTVDDIILALSWSGETAELGDLVDFSRRFALPLIAVTSRADSSLARSADIRLLLPRSEEACPHGLAPTTSTVMQLAIGDALAVALLEGRGFTSSDFKQFHPGGRLGSRLLVVKDLMHKGDEIPLVSTSSPMHDVLISATSKRLGCVGVIDQYHKLVGIVTDGDLRRNMGDDLLKKHVMDIMTKSPITIMPDLLASSAVEIMNRECITVIFVAMEGNVLGVVHIHDLLRAGII